MRSENTDLNFETYPWKGNYEMKGVCATVVILSNEFLEEETILSFWISLMRS